jgi:hypothetical protein
MVDDVKADKAPDMTPEQAAKIEAEALARAKAFDAQVKELLARKALETAMAPPPAPAPADPAVAAAKQAKESADLRKAEAEADKAAVEARNAAGAAAVPKLPDAPTSGKITLSEGAGLAEATMLGVESVGSLAQAIAQRLNALPAGGRAARRFALVPMTAVPDLQRWVAFGVRRRIMRQRIDALAADEAAAALPTDAAVTAAAVSAGLAFLATALNWLKPDHEFKGLALDGSDPMLLAALAEQLLALKAEVHLPSLQGSVAAEPGQPALQALREPFDMLDSVAAWAAKTTPLHPRWTALQAELKAWCDSLVAADAAGVVPLQALVREAQTLGALGPGAYVVGVTLHKLVGSAHAKKGGLGGSELLVSGAAVASYVAWAAADGTVVSAGLLPHEGRRRSVR